MEAVIDLKEPTEIQSASISTCVERVTGYLMPVLFL